MKRKRILEAYLVSRRLERVDGYVAKLAETYHGREEEDGQQEDQPEGSPESPGAGS